MSKKIRWALLAVGAAAGALALGLGSAGAASHTAFVRGGTSFKIDGYVKDSVHFVPRTIDVASGDTLTWLNKGEPEPHTITVASRSELPRTDRQIEQCRVCRLAAGHFKNPKNPQAGIKTRVLNNGPAGFDERGDSLILPPKGRASTRVSAPAGTTLYYFCAIHPWMQGRIRVH